MMLFGIRRLAAAQASARMLPRSLRTHATQSEKRGRPHGWRGSTELQRTDASTTHLAERLLLGRQLLLWLGLHLRGVLHEHGLVHQILYEGAARGRQLLCGTRDAPSVGPPGLGRCSTRARAGGRSAPARRERDAAMVLQYSLLNLAASATQTYAEYPSAGARFYSSCCE